MAVFHRLREGVGTRAVGNYDDDLRSVIWRASCRSTQLYSPDDKSRLSPRARQYMKKGKDSPRRAGTKRGALTRARTASGKKPNTELLASAEQKARDGLRERTEEGHLKAGRTPPSQKSSGRRSGATRIDDSIRDSAPVTEDEKLLQQR